MSQLTIDSLIAENIALRKAIEFAIAPGMWVERERDILEYKHSVWYVDVLKAALNEHQHMEAKNDGTK